MRELETLRHHERTAAPADRYQAVVASARRRQRTALAAAGGGATAAVVAAVLLLTGGGATDSLRVVTPAGHGNTTTTPPRATGHLTHPATQRPGVAVSAAKAGTGSVGTAAGPRAANQGAESSSTGSRQAGPQPMHRSYSGSDQQTVCGGIVTHAQPPTTPRYCGDVAAATDAHGRVEFDLTGTLDAASRPSQFSFSTSQEVDLAIYRGGKLVWRWSTGQRFAHDSHSLPLQSGSSYDWTTTWQPTDVNGKRLAHGDYDVVGTILASELGSDNSWTTTLTL